MPYTGHSCFVGRGLQCSALDFSLSQFDCIRSIGKNRIHTGTIIHRVRADLPFCPSYYIQTRSASRKTKAFASRLDHTANQPVRQPGTPSDLGYSCHCLQLLMDGDSQIYTNIIRPPGEALGEASITPSIFYGLRRILVINPTMGADHLCLLPGKAATGSRTD